MGFFDFLATKTETKYVDIVSNNNWALELSKVLLSNEYQRMMYNGIRDIRTASTPMMSSPSQENILNFQNTVKSVIESGRALENWLFNRNIQELKSEHLTTAFYLINMADTTLKDATEFSESTIKNTFATNLVAIGYKNIQPDDISSISIMKIKIAVKWLLSHPID